MFSLNFYCGYEYLACAYKYVNVWGNQVRLILKKVNHYHKINKPRTKCDRYIPPSSWNFDSSKFVVSSEIMCGKKSKKCLFREMFILALLSSGFFSLQKCASDFFLMVLSGDKRPLSELLRKWDWFHRHNYCFPKYLG